MVKYAKGIFLASFELLHILIIWQCASPSSLSKILTWDRVSLVALVVINQINT